MNKFCSAAQTAISRFIKNFPFFISGCAVIVMNVTSGITLIIAVLLLLILIAATCRFDRISEFFKCNVSKRILTLAACISLLSGYVYYISFWREAVLYSSKLETLYQSTGIPKFAMAVPVVIIPTVLSVYFFSVILCLFTSSYLKMEKRKCKKTISKMDVIALCVMIVVVLCVGYRYLTLKNGFNIDEMYTFGLANSYYEPFLTVPSDGVGIASTADAYQSYLTAAENPFSYGSVLYNQICDVHPPLYYIVIHTLCSLWPEASFSTVGFAVNAVFIVLTMIGMFLWMLRKFHRPVAYAVTICYGLSMGLLSMLLFFRMYSMFTFFTFLITAIFYEFYSNPDAKCFKSLALVLCLGGFTHYYFFVYVFFAALILAVMLILEKRYRQFRNIAIATGASACIYYGVWGNVIVLHLLGYRGEEAFSSIASESGTVAKLKEYFDIVLQQISPSRALAMCLLILLSVMIISLIVIAVKDSAKRVRLKQCLLLTIPWLLYFLLVSKIAPYQSARYIYNTLPFIWISFWMVFHSVIPVRRRERSEIESTHPNGTTYDISEDSERSDRVCGETGKRAFGRPKWASYVICTCIVLVSVTTSLFLTTPDFLYLEGETATAYLDSQGEDTVCIYYCSLNFNAAIHCANYFMNFREIYLVDADSLEWLESENVESDNGKIVLLAESDENLDEILQILGYHTVEEIGGYHYVTVYELSE